MKGISKNQPNIIKFEGYKKCLDGGKDPEECENYILRSVNHERYLQEEKKSTKSISDDRRCYINYIESEPWMNCFSS